MHSYCCIAFGCLNSNLIFNSFDCVFSKKCKPFSFIPFPPFSFPAHLCFEDQPLKSVGRPSVHPLQTLTALLLAQLRLLNPTTRSRLPPLIFFFASSRTLQPLGLTGPTATASPPRSLPPLLPLPGGAHMSCPTSRHHGADSSRGPATIAPTSASHTPPQAWRARQGAAPQPT
jgi:hypothetical protein